MSKGISVHFGKFFLELLVPRSLSPGFELRQIANFLSEEDYRRTLKLSGQLIFHFTYLLDEKIEIAG